MGFKHHTVSTATGESGDDTGLAASFAADVGCSTDVSRSTRSISITSLALDYWCNTCV